MGWRAYVDGQVGALRDLVDRVFLEHQKAVGLSRECQATEMAAFKAYVDRVFAEHQKAVVLVQTQTAEQVHELNGTSAQLTYVDAVFTEHRRAIDATLIGNADALKLAIAQVDARFIGVDKAVTTALAGVLRDAEMQREAVKVALTRVETKIDAAQQLAAERVDGVRREAIAAQASAAAATGKVETATEKRFENVNEFREQINDQAQRFMLREVAEAKLDDQRRATDVAVAELRQQITVLQQRADLTAGATAGSQRSTAMLITGVGLFLSIIVFLANYVFSQ